MPTIPSQKAEACKLDLTGYKNKNGTTTEYTLKIAAFAD